MLNNSFITNNVLYSITMMSNLLGLLFSTVWPLKKHFLFSVKCITQGVEKQGSVRCNIANDKISNFLPLKNKI